MIKLSQKALYGIRAVVELAQSEGKALSATEIAQRQRIPEPFLNQILLQLRRAGLVRSKRGPGGGYLLNRFPEKITLAQVITALEGPIALAQCLEPLPLQQEECEEFFETCVARIVLRRVQDRLLEVLATTTVRDVLKEIRPSGEPGVPIGVKP